MRLHEIATPTLVVDAERLERNLAFMAGRCATLGVKLRPHYKTHKCLEVLARQRDHGALGVTVSTLYEARTVIDAGHDDVTWAFPIILNRLDEIQALASRATLRLVVDSRVAVDALAGLGMPLHVWLKVDSGYGRAGVDPEAPATIDLVRRIHASPLIFDGLLSHCGHAYQAETPAAIVEIAETDRKVMTSLAAGLRGAGLPVPTVSVGSTPSMSLAEGLEGVDEARPGNYVFFDHDQHRLGACALDDCALTVLTSVVSCGPRHAIVDAGALALSKDAGLGRGTPILGAVMRDDGTLDPTRHVVAVSQEHGHLSVPAPVGTRLRLLPNHACLTVACFDQLVVVRGDEVEATWAIHRGRD